VNVSTTVRAQVLSFTSGSGGFWSGWRDQWRPLVSADGFSRLGAASAAWRATDAAQIDHARRPARPFRTVTEVAQSSFGIRLNLMVVQIARKLASGKREAGSVLRIACCVLRVAWG
jgi:hypothetical protein